MNKKSCNLSISDHMKKKYIILLIQKSKKKVYNNECIVFVIYLF